jgi:hypothetical protein
MLTLIVACATTILSNYLTIVSSIVKPFQELERIYHRLANEKVVKWSASYLNLVYPTQRINLELVHHMSIEKH